MKKSELREIVRTIVKNKLDELSISPPSQWGKDKDPDPRLTLPGYGSMPLSQWKKKVVDDLKKVLKYAEEGNIKNVQYYIKDKEILPNIVNMIVAHEGEGIHEEVQGNHVGQSATTSTTTPTTDQTTAPVVDPTNQIPPQEKLRLDTLKADQEKLTDVVRRKDGEIQKLQEPVKRKVQKLELEKAKAQQKMGNVTGQITAIQDKYNK